MSLIYHKVFCQDFQIGGYSKYLFSFYKVHPINENLIDHTLHSRINSKLFLNNYINLNAGIRNRIIYGKSLEKIPDYENKIAQNEYSLKLNSFIWKKKKTINFIELDRLWLDMNFENLQISLGRQRIAWGTSWVWNITDLFNPLSILDFDYEERPASDGIRLQYFPSITSKFDFATKFGKTKEDFTSAIQFYYNNFEYDFYFLVGYYKLRPVLGFSFSGDILDAGFRGEILVVSPPDQMKLNYKNLFSTEKKAQLSAVLSLDYTFTSSFYIHSEVMFNNIGRVNSIALYSQSAIELGMLSASRWNLFYQVGYSISPLSRIDLIALHNPIDHSLAFLPVFIYSVMENLDVSLIFFISKW